MDLKRPQQLRGFFSSCGILTFSCLWYTCWEHYSVSLVQQYINITLQTIQCGRRFFALHVFGSFGVFLSTWEEEEGRPNTVRFWKSSVRVQHELHNSKRAERPGRLSWADCRFLTWLRFQSWLLTRRKYRRSFFPKNIYFFLYLRCFFLFHP